VTIALYKFTFTISITITTVNFSAFVLLHNKSWPAVHKVGDGNFYCNLVLAKKQ